MAVAIIRKKKLNLKRENSKGKLELITEVTPESSKISMIQMLIPLGLKAVEEALLEEVQSLVGLKYQRDDNPFQPPTSFQNVAVTALRLISDIHKGLRLRVQAGFLDLNVWSFKKTSTRLYDSEIIRRDPDSFGFKYSQNE